MKLGIKDEAFVRGKVPMTKEEIRILTLVKAQIAPDAVVYDVGAGTGSLSIEAARLAPAGHVYAIEKNADGVGLIAENAKRFGVENITQCRQSPHVWIIFMHTQIVMTMRRYRYRSVGWSASVPMIWQRRSTPSISSQHRESEEGI